MVTILFALGLLSVGLMTVVLSFEVLGRTENWTKKKNLLIFHKVFGYLFVLIFLMLFAGMLQRFSQSSFSVKADIHVALAMGAGMLLLVKILIVRRYKKLSSHLFMLGSTLYLLSFIMVLIVVGPVFSSKNVFAPVADGSPPSTGMELTLENLKISEPETRFVRLCGQCHELDRTFYSFQKYKTEAQWEEVIERMRSKTNTISENDVKALAGYLAQFNQE